VRTLGLALTAALLIALLASLAGTPANALAGPNPPAGPGEVAFQDGDPGENGGIFVEPPADE